MWALAFLSQMLAADATPILIESDKDLPRSGQVAPSPSLDQPALVIRGKNLILDFKGFTLRGSPATAEPDQRQGLGVQVEGENITIKNLQVHGYKVGLRAENVPGLRILDSDFSYNWKQRLKSDLEREDLSDWMSFHQNEKDEWLRFGAGIYLRGCDRFEVQGTRITGGQCGLMLTRCDNGLIWNNNFSFLSAVGLGLYRSRENRVLHNRIDWCVRGYSHGVYNRGQDSTGILIYEQSHRNVFAYNSVTHGGDGFFLWAGQSTMDSGKGGCNDNLLYMNDWSHAPTNGIEATFSRNTFVRNLVMECWHGIWGGFSYDSLVKGNLFAWNGQAIAWEHGQSNQIVGNRFIGDHEGVVLWQNDRVDPNWGYGRFRDTRSRDNAITDNLFRGTSTQSISVKKSENTLIRGNTFDRVKSPGEPADGTATKIEGVLPPRVDKNGVEIGGLSRPEYLRAFEDLTREFLKMEPTPEVRKLAPARMRGGQSAFLPTGTLRGRRYILVDEWGPYDFRSPRAWPRALEAEPDGSLRVRLETLGPKGRWKVVSGTDGVEPSARTGVIGDELEVSVPRGKANDFWIELESVGAESTDYRGVVTPAGQPVRFRFARVRFPIDWEVRYYPWSEANDPRQFGAKVFDQEPIFTEKLTELNKNWWGAAFAGGPSERFATLSTGRLNFPAGKYRLEVTTDDGVRVTVGDQVVIEGWKYQGPTTYGAEVELSGGEPIRVEHFEIDGFACLKVSLRPAR